MDDGDEHEPEVMFYTGRPVRGFSNVPFRRIQSMSSKTIWTYNDKYLLRYSLCVCFLWLFFFFLLFPRQSNISNVRNESVQEPVYYVWLQVYY